MASDDTKNRETETVGRHCENEKQLRGEVGNIVLLANVGFLQRKKQKN